MSQRNQTNVSQTLGNVTEGHKNSLILLPAILTSVQLFGIAGNALVIHAISTPRRFQTNYYYLVYHLALSDLFVLLTYFDETLHYGIPSLPPISFSVVCKLLDLVAWLFYVSGALFLVAIGLLRYRGTIYPFKVSLTRKKIRYRVVVTTYLVSFLISTGFAMLRKCRFHDDLYVHNIFMAVLAFFFTCLIPVVLLPVLYLKIIYRLWSHQRNLENKFEPTARNSSNNKASSSETQVKQRRFIRTSLVSFIIVVVFSISSAPYDIFWLITIVRKSDFTGIPFWIVFMKLFGTCSVNPLIYGVSDASLRQNFRQTFRRIVKCCKR